jgi:hypothetical protein
MRDFELHDKLRSHIRREPEKFKELLTKAEMNGVAAESVVKFTLEK